MDKLISIIVPIYKVEKELPRCVNSLISQTFTSIEIILVDDGSPDSCPYLCDKMAAQDNRIIVIHKANGGLSSARNAGLKRATGKYVLYVDSDDYLQPDGCERFIETMKRLKATYTDPASEETVDLVVGVAKEIDGQAVRYQRHTNLEPGKIYSSDEYLKKSISAMEWYAPAWLNLYSLKFLKSNHLCFKTGILHEDFEILPRLFLRAQTVVYMDYAFYNYLTRPGSIMKSGNYARNIHDITRIYSSWVIEADAIRDKKLKKLFCGILCKYYLKSCARFEIYDNIFPTGVTKGFLIRNSLNVKEFVKTVLFCISRSKYINLCKNMSDTKS